MNIDSKILSNLTDEQKKAVESAQSLEELRALAKDNGYELSPEELEGIAGGDNWKCPRVDECPDYCGYLH